MLQRRTIPDVLPSLERPSQRHGWTSDISLAQSDLQTTDAYSTVWLVCEFLTLLALIVFFIGSFMIQAPKDRTKALPVWTVFGSILSYMVARILSIALLFLYVFNRTVSRSYVVVNMFEIIFNLLALVLLYSIFYRIVHRYLEGFAEGDAFARVILAHWTLLGVLSALAIANCATRIASVAVAVNQSQPAEALYQQDSRLTTARGAIFTLASLEILGWMVFILRKTDLQKSQNKTGTIALALAVVSSFAQNLTTTITTIQSSLIDHSPAYLNAIATLVEFFCVLGIYTGIIICSLQWQKSIDDATAAAEETAAARSPPSRSSFHPTSKGKQPSRPQYLPYRPSMGEVLDQQHLAQPHRESSQGVAPRYYMTSGWSKSDQQAARMSGGRGYEGDLK
ncbi:integral membrane protein [Aspergillus terreus]|uniref:Integral membrane protein n=1 Tax=Aspergillus terreus TaxID=33178 RepID=A0A5M3ZD57_ASPTE|nr:hypothetical protein ATETN484_0016010800 [Aspergillus terreus]GFF21537.1 integral membrane protein [Aspergillus terreus]